MLAVRGVAREVTQAFIFIPGAIAILGRSRWSDHDAPTPVPRLPWRTWAARAPLIAGAYVAFYLSFGYWVAWQFAEVRQLYTGSPAPTGVLDQMLGLIRDEPAFIPFQLLRGVLWMVFAAPLVVLLRERRTTMVALGAVLFVFGAQILLPSAFFPPTVRLAHFLETASSTGLFGLLLGWALTPRGAPAADPARSSAAARPLRGPMGLAARARGTPAGARRETRRAAGPSAACPRAADRRRCGCRSPGAGSRSAGQGATGPRR